MVPFFPPPGARRGLEKKKSGLRHEIKSFHLPDKKTEQNKHINSTRNSLSHLTWTKFLSHLLESGSHGSCLCVSSLEKFWSLHLLCFSCASFSSSRSKWSHFPHLRFRSSTFCIRVSSCCATSWPGSQWSCNEIAYLEITGAKCRWVCLPCHLSDTRLHILLK